MFGATSHGQQYRASIDHAVQGTLDDAAILFGDQGHHPIAAPPAKMQHGDGRTYYRLVVV